MNKQEEYKDYIEKYDNAFENSKHLFKNELVNVLKANIQTDKPINSKEVYTKLENIIRTAYQSHGKITENSYKDIINLVMKNKHLSVLEHQQLTFNIQTSIGIQNELVRHRIGQSYTVESSRYCNYKNKGYNVIFPYHLIKKSDGEKEVRYDAMCNIMGYYEKFKGYQRDTQSCAGILPKDLKSNVVMSGNIRSLGHLLELRCADDAHPNMQLIAKKIWLILNEDLDLFFK